MVELTLNLDAAVMDLDKSTENIPMEIKNEERINCEAGVVPTSERSSELVGIHKPQQKVGNKRSAEKIEATGKKLSDNQYTSNLATDVISGSVSALDESQFIKQIDDEQSRYENMLNCIIKVSYVWSIIREAVLHLYFNSE